MRRCGAEWWILVSDTSWPGYEGIPRMIMCGYTQLIMEAARQWSSPPDIVFVQAGVGGLACAMGSWFAFQFGQWRPYLICCQAEKSACVLEAARHGAPVPLEGSLETVMDCLSAGEVSHSAWPFLHAIFDAYLSVPDELAIEAAGVLEESGIAAGYSGACGMAALLGLVRNERLEPLRRASGLGAASRVLLIVTEGPAIKE
jgi:diaminopropionate ammonia-lyase